MVAFSIFDQIKKEGRTVLTEFESKKVLEQIGVPIVETRLAKTQKEAGLISQEIGFPVALKIVSPEVVHKSDAGGVKLGLNSIAQVRSAYREMIGSIEQKFPDAVIHGVSVQKMARPGAEVIVGSSKDPQFGPVIMFGLGGIFVEVLKDVSFRIVPVLEKDAEDMIQEIKGYSLLEGYRGREPANIPALVEMILKLSRFVEENQQVKELELNPVMTYSDGVLAVDARIILEEDETR